MNLMISTTGVGHAARVRRTWVAVAACALTLFATASHAALRTYALPLSGAQEVANGDPDGTGTAILVIDDVANTISWQFTLANVATPITLAHIHQGAAGVNGSVVVDFGGQLSGTGLADGDLAAVVANPANFYVNLHNGVHPTGAVRGQLPNAPVGGQIVTPRNVTQSVQPNTAFSVEPRYTTNPNDTTLTGLGLRIHWDSTKVSFVSMTGLVQEDQIVGQDSMDQDDVRNEDGDPATDKFRQIAWASTSSRFPNMTEPVSLYTGNFMTLPTFTNGETRIRFSSSSTAVGYRLLPTPATVGPPDTQAPLITLQGASTINIVEGVAFQDPGCSAQDNRDGTLPCVRTGAVDSNVIGTYTLRYNVTDAAGNAATQVTRTVNVTLGPDLVLPVVTAPAAITVEATGPEGTARTATAVAAFLAGATATDNRDPRTVPAANITNNAPTTLPIGTTTVVFSATDASNNVGTASANITVADRTPPTVTPPANLVVEATSATGVARDTTAVTTFLAGATASDLVDLARQVTNDAPTAFPLGVTTVTFTASDTRNNSGTATATVTVRDTTPPVITAPERIDINTDSTSGIPSANNAVQSAIAAITATDVVGGVRPVTNNAPANLPVGTTNVTFTARDAANNSATAVVAVVVTLGPDTVAPTVTAPANISVEATGAGGTAKTAAAIAAFLAGATATDGRDGTIANVTNDGPATFPIGPTTVTFGATDQGGNAGTATATVTVVDTTAPTVTAPVNLVVEATGPTGVPVALGEVAAFLAGATASDLVDGTRTVTNNAPATLQLGVTTVTFTASDTRNNSRNATATVTVRDTTPPVLTGPDAVTIEAQGASGTPSSAAAVQAAAAQVTAADIVGGNRTVTNSLPATLPIGTTNVTFSASDAANNTATRVVAITVRDSLPPTLTPPANLGPLLVAGANGTIARSQARVQTFLNAATANDAVDGTRTVTNNAPETFPVGVTIVTFSALDTRGNSATATATVTVSVAGTGDGDGDGMPDDYEVANGFDPGSAADGADPCTSAACDADNDGDSNRTEFQNGTDPRADTTPPLLTIPADITIDATGPRTPVDTRSATATSVDRPAGNRPITVTGDGTSFPPGRFVVTYRSADPAGNASVREQVIVVRPQVQVGQPQTLGEGRMALVELLLNGDAPVYPVTVDFTVSGTAQNPGDHDLANGTVTIESGRRGTIAFNIVQDAVAESAETVVITLTGATNGVLGANRATTVNIVEANVAPVLEVTASQGEQTGTRVVRGGGNVTARVDIADPNQSDAFTIDWSTSAAALARVGATNATTFVFDVANVAPGNYPLIVKVTDAGGLMVTADALITVVATAPNLTAGDSDGDGESDQSEGAGDSDGDGLPDFVDDDRMLAEQLPAGSDGGGGTLTTEAGLRLKVGDTAFVVQNNGAGVTIAELGSNGGANGGSASNTDALYNYPLPWFDFVVEGTATGGVVNVVLQFGADLPAGNLVLRKFRQGTFSSFVVDANNAVSSAPQTAGVCPAPRSSAYVSGLTAGHRCVQIRIQDGGPNDTDGVANGRIEDPSTVGVFVPVAPPAVQVGATRSSSGGGCSVGSGPADPLLPALLLAACAYLLRRRMVLGKI